MKRNRRGNEFTDACHVLAFGAALLCGCGGNDNAIRRSDILGGAAGSSVLQYSSAATITRTSSVQGGGGTAACLCSAEPQCPCASTTAQNLQGGGGSSTDDYLQHITSGGTLSTGGVTSGSTNTGDVITSGGTSNTDGTFPSGGMLSTGGVTLGGTSTGAIPSGGTSNTGGGIASSVTSASGGVTSGGTSSTAGVIASGGTSSTGGSTSGGASTSGVTSGGTSSTGGVTSSPSTGVGGSNTTPTAPTCSPACAGGNASWECAGGSCKVLACEPDYRDCDGAVLGCETNIQSSVDHCGSCTTACSGGNAEWSCQQGQCVAKACAAGFADCSSAPGCETSAARNPSHCGRCNNACSLLVCRNEGCLDHKVRDGNTGPGQGYFNVAKNYLIGERIKVEAPSVLIGFGIALNANAFNVQAYAGVYEDALNTPGKLLAGGQSSLQMGPGGAEFETEQVDLLPGNYYWLLVVTNETAMYAYNNPTTKSGNTRYISYAYQALPTSAPATMDIPNIPDPNFYLIVAQ
ncbi:MAG: hypothetical protein ACM3ZE_05805 [Myxococcales bacterium]